LQNICEWKQVQPFPRQYMVSSNGEVYSTRAKKIIKPNHDKHGYLYYVLCVNGDRRTIKAHRLVANAFIPNPDKKPTVNHKNGIRDDNCVNNLEWATNKEQVNDQRTKDNLKKAHGRTDYQAMGARRNFGRKQMLVNWNNGTKNVYPSLKAAAEATGINYGHLSEILHGKRPQRKEFSIEAAP